MALAIVWFVARTEKPIPALSVLVVPSVIVPLPNGELTIAPGEPTVAIPPVSQIRVPLALFSRFKPPENVFAFDRVKGVTPEFRFVRFTVSGLAPSVISAAVVEVWFERLKVAAEVPPF